MAKLFFFIAVAVVLVSATAARYAPAPASALKLEGVVVPNEDSTYRPGDSGQVNCGNYRNVSPKDCMLGIIQEAQDTKFCKKKCNILLHTRAGRFRADTLDFPFHIQDFYIDGRGFRIYIFHGKAYFETDGWYGWENWAFSGNFTHAPKTPVVQFFPYGKPLTVPD